MCSARWSPIHPYATEVPIKIMIMQPPTLTLAAELDGGLTNEQERVPQNIDHLSRFLCSKSSKLRTASPSSHPPKRGRRCEMCCRCRLIRAVDRRRALARHVALPQPQGHGGTDNLVGTGRLPLETSGSLCGDRSRGKLHFDEGRPYAAYSLNNPWYGSGCWWRRFGRVWPFWRSIAGRLSCHGVSGRGTSATFLGCLYV
jgi:hypothetical protein